MNQKVVTEIVRQEQFESIQLMVIEQDGEEWFPAEDIGKALEFSEPRKSVLNIYNRQRDEFEGLSRVTKLMTRGKDGIARSRKYTIFNPQGCYLLALHAHTPKGKKLRLWVSKFMAKDLSRLKSQHEEDQKFIEHLKDQILEKVSWDDIEEPPSWFRGVNARLKFLEAQVKDLGVQQAPSSAPAVDPKDLILVPTKYLQKFREMAGPDHFAKTQRLFHAILQAQGEWETLIRQLDKLGLLAVTGEAYIRHDPARFIADKLKLN